jgi:hypothetical protein
VVSVVLLNFSRKVPKIKTQITLHPVPSTLFAQALDAMFSEVLRANKGIQNANSTHHDHFNVGLSVVAGLDKRRNMNEENDICVEISNIMNLFLFFPNRFSFIYSQMSEAC